jgi:hypothetical protein
LVLAVWEDGETAFLFHRSPGTQVMAAMWVFLANTSHSGKVIESSKEHGVQTVSS